MQLGTKRSVYLIAPCDCTIHRHIYIYIYKSGFWTWESEYWLPRPSRGGRWNVINQYFDVPVYKLYYNTPKRQATNILSECSLPFMITASWVYIVHGIALLSPKIEWRKIKWRELRKIFEILWVRRAPTFPDLVPGGISDGWARKNMPCRLVEAWNTARTLGKWCAWEHRMQ